MKELKVTIVDDAHLILHCTEEGEPRRGYSIRRKPGRPDLEFEEMMGAAQRLLRPFSYHQV